eukprot:gene5270-10546_t
MAQENAKKIDYLLEMDVTDETLIQYLKDLSESQPMNDNNKFQLAMALSKSPLKEDKLEAVHLFSEFTKKPSFMQDAFYGLSLTHYMLADYHVARQYIEELLRQNPDNTQYKDLHLAVMYKHDRQTKTEETVATVGLAVGVGLVASALVFLLRPSKK